MFLLELDNDNDMWVILWFSSPIFGDMFLLQNWDTIHELQKVFSSPIFGDMFLLDGSLTILYQ